MTALVAYLDADIIMHRAASFCDDEFDGVPSGDWKEGMGHFDRIKRTWLSELKRSKFKIEDYFLVFSVGQNFRKGFFPDYKANRKDLVMWPGLRHMKEELLQLHEAVSEDGIEADDIIGIRCTESVNTIAVSADKDFQTVPCKLMIPTSHGRTDPILYDTTEAEADLNWLRQTMTGDTVDNYKGIKRCGEVTAAKILPNHEDVSIMWPKVVAAFESKGQTDALTMARLARILRDGEYNWETKEVILWEPK